MRHFFCLVFTLVLVACNESSPSPGSLNPLPPTDAAERERLESLCGCVEAPAEMPTPPGSPDLWCYDGCNWCGCSEDGRQTCTARFCADAGPIADDAGVETKDPG